MPSRDLNFPVFDADNHFYEPREALTKFLPDGFKNVIDYVDVRGRTKIVVRGQISDYIPNPTFDVVARPGAQEEYYRHGNPDGKSYREIMGEPMKAIPAFREPGPRLEVMDELGLDYSLMFPTLASLVEERMKEDAGIPVAMHASDSGYNDFLNAWEPSREFTPFKPTPFRMIAMGKRPIEDAMTALVCHGALSRLPKLRVISVENGAGWVKGLLKSFADTYAKMPAGFVDDPVEAFKRGVYITPFWEENFGEVVELMGADRCAFGSDWPHPEGLSDPITYVDDLKGLPDDDVARIMGGNLMELMKVKAPVPA